MKKNYILPVAALLALGANAQSWHAGDINWPESQQLASNFTKWSTDHKISDDDNFFISRVKPRVRFQNSATQVNPDLKWNENDKRLCAWLPININSDGNRNALPTGEFDSECFTMWSYVDHFGNWSAPLGGIPGNFTDVAHKNGVSVSSVAGTPFGAITSEWSTALTAMSKLDGSELAKMLVYYGHDGIGYNSEFSGFYSLAGLRTMHEKLWAGINTEFAKVTPGYNMAENMWYDGTNDRGTINFDNGLSSTNYQNWGPLGQERTSLFFNYNWSNRSGALLEQSVNNAASASIGKGRNPLWLYCGINMQGGEPRASYDHWDIIGQYNVSIGLWGAHSENMFWQYRGENGSSTEAKQNTYQNRLENWFTSGTHNPVNDLPLETRTMTCSSTDKDFHGMSRFMSARSAMSWNLDEEPFYSFFNVGNGRYFNWKGVRENNCEWYNIGVQDYMPTWRWWWSTKFLGTNAADVPATGLTAQFSWDDAYVGGSCLKLSGSTDGEYLHLFKTSYALKAGDVITVRYKLVGGSGAVNFVYSVEGSENTVAKSMNVCEDGQMIDDGTWTTKQYTVAAGDGLAGKTLAMVAINVEKAAGMQLYVGEFSIKRAAAPAPTKPEITNVVALRNTDAGIDGKVILNVANNKPAGTVCYNSDVNVSMFKIYAQEEGEEPILMGVTTSWAAMCYSTPFKGDQNGQGSIRYGVSSLSLDTDTESEIAWSDYQSITTRTYSDAIQIDKSTVTPDEEFTFSTVDDKREFQWALYPTGEEGAQAVAQSDGKTNKWVCSGISEIGTYDLVLTGPNTEDSSDNAKITHAGYLVITDAARGRIPEIYTLTANDQEADIKVKPNEEIMLAYTGREADGACSRGIAITEKFFGVKASEVLDSESSSFSVAGWMKIDNFPGAVDFVDICERDGSWPRNNWGWLWSSINTDGTLQNYDQDMSYASAGATTNVLRYDFGNNKTRIFNKGQWTHFAMIFDRSTTKTRTLLYINGKQVESTWNYYNCSDYDNNMRVAQSGSTNDYTTAYKALSLNNMIMVGGTRHPGRDVGGNGLTGALDEFQVWNKAMTAEEVKQSMEGFDPNNLPDGLAGYWDFEDTPGADNMYVAKGSKAGAVGGYFELQDDPAAEGRSRYVYLRPVAGTGCPFIDGSDYKITTKPTWKARLGEITDVTGSDKEGSAKLTFAREGDDYTAELTLANDLGSASRTFQFIKVGDLGAIGDIAADGELRTYTIDDVLYLDVVADGLYNVSIFDINGRAVANKAQQVAAGDFMQITLNGAPGVYVVNVLRDGMKAKSFKVIKK